MLLVSKSLISKVSIHAPREGCDGASRFQELDLKGSNSRTPGGVRLGDITAVVEVVVVSIHAPREGCDNKTDALVRRVYGFQFTHPGRGATRATK